MGKRSSLLTLDGSLGEGGGQLVRIACSLAAITTTSIRITNIRVNRPGSKGLNAQLLTALQYLAKITAAETKGLFIGSPTLEFCPHLPPTVLKERKIVISPRSTAASALLIFQTVFPFLLYAGNENNEPIELEIEGSTNPTFSPSFEYLDQVFLPSFEKTFGIVVERRLQSRAWTMGPSQEGSIWVKFTPLRPHTTLQLVTPWPETSPEGIARIDLTIVVLASMHETLKADLMARVGTAFPDTPIHFVVEEDSGHEARMYVLVVMHSSCGLRRGRDFLYNITRKGKSAEVIATEIADTITGRLKEMLAIQPAALDANLQDQMVIFQALAEERSSYWTSEMEGWGTRMRMDDDGDVFGFGSEHTRTARWVTGNLLGVRWFNKGSVCEGAAVVVD